MHIWAGLFLDLGLFGEGHKIGRENMVGIFPEELEGGYDQSRLYTFKIFSMNTF